MADVLTLANIEAMLEYLNKLDRSPHPLVYMDELNQYRDWPISLPRTDSNKKDP